jgi:hypothetical protein
VSCTIDAIPLPGMELPGAAGNKYRSLHQEFTTPPQLSGMPWAPLQ